VYPSTEEGLGVEPSNGKKVYKNFSIERSTHVKNEEDLRLLELVNSKAEGIFKEIKGIMSTENREI